MTVEGLRSAMVYLKSLTDQWVSIRLVDLKFMSLFTGFSNFSLKFLGLLEIEGWVWVCVLCVLNF